MKCYANIGSADTPKRCSKKAKFIYIMSKRFSSTCLCNEHAKEADKNEIVKYHFIKKEAI